MVTSGAGFIGSYLCEAFFENYKKVVCLDNFATRKKENVIAILNNPNFILITMDIRNLQDCLLETKGKDFVLHQAGL